VEKNTPKINFRIGSQVFLCALCASVVSFFVMRNYTVFSNTLVCLNPCHTMMATEMAR
jgi:hypothetical protein